MLIRKTYKYRIYPNKIQKELLARQFGCVRWVYNYFLDMRITHYEKTGKNISYNKMAVMLPNLKKEYVWLKDPHSQTLQCSLADLDSAYKNFFEGRANFPNFKSKNSKQSCRYPQGFKFEKTTTYLPKIGWVKTIFHRKLKGDAKQITVSKTKTNKYFISISVEEEINTPKPENRKIGIDLGLKHFLTTSDGDKIPNPKHLRKSEKRLKRLHKQFSRKRKGSNNRENFRVKLAKQYEKVANQRKDFHHKTSKYFIDNYSVLAIEDLNIRGLVKNHKLAKSILDVGWGQFVQFLNYKAVWYGSEVIKVDRFFPSSKRHFGCGWVKKDLKLSDREWICENCGEIVDRDINAAKNILAYTTVGVTESYAWEDLVVTES